MDARTNSNPMTPLQLYRYIISMRPKPAPPKPMPPVVVPQRLLWDRVSEQRLRTLDPRIIFSVRKFINDAEDEGIYLRITSAYRTNEEQAALYAQGRTKPGKKVTWVKPGQSLHNHRLAVDVVEMRDRQPVWENPNWERIGQLGEAVGLQWGGRWRPERLDRPHFERGDLLDT